MLEKQQKRIRRHKRVRAKIKGTVEIPRFCVFRSVVHIYAQLIDDENGKTIITACDQELKGSKSPASKIKQAKEKDGASEKVLSGKIFKAYQVGQLIAQKSAKKNIKKVVFDRAGYSYHGRVKALAEGAKKAGFEF